MGPWAMGHALGEGPPGALPGDPRRRSPQPGGRLAGLCGLQRGRSLGLAGGPKALLCPGRVGGRPLGGPLRWLN